MSENPQGPRTSPPPSGRAQILRAALEEFAAAGFDGTTTARIAESAGVTQPLIHHHFGTKLDLWKAAVDEAFGELESLQAPLLEALVGLEPGVRVRVLVRQMILFTVRKPALMRILVLESGRESERTQYILDNHLRAFARRFQLLLDESMKGGKVRALDSRLISLLGMGAASVLALVPVHAQSLYELDMTDPEMAERFADLVVDVLVNGVKTPEAELELPATPTRKKR